jgi:hypothetical protein
MTSLLLRNDCTKQATIHSHYIRNRGCETHQERVEVITRRMIHERPFLSSGEGEMNSRTLYLT